MQSQNQPEWFPVREDLKKIVRYNAIENLCSQGQRLEMIVTVLFTSIAVNLVIYFPPRGITNALKHVKL